jgi:Ca2+-binding RTX toxin-like protein
MTHSRSRASQTSGDFFNPSFQLETALRLPIADTAAAGAIADFNDDGNPDLVFTLTDATLSDNVIVRLGNGKGSFGTAKSAAAGASPIAIVTGDFNGDGKLDLATASLSANTVSLLLGNGDGTVGAASTLKVGSKPNSLITADFNGDGKLDLATANADFGAGNLSILLGKGDGTFSSRTISDRAQGKEPFAVATGDFDGDGKLDLATVEGRSSTLMLLFGDGTGSFGETKTFDLSGIQPVALTTGDFDGDGKLDIATVNQVNSINNVLVLLGNGNGGFKKTVALTTNLVGNAIAAQDLNGDGKLDIVTANREASQIAVFAGDGKGGFSKSSTAAVGKSPNGLAVGDLNRDGKPDLVTANAGTTDASIVLNRSVFILFKQPSSGKSGIVDASGETKVSITVDLSQQSMTVNRSPVTRYRLDNYREVLGTQSRDSLTGSSNADTLTGNGGKDTLIGNGGDDQLNGGGGNDNLLGGKGNDDLNGGKGNDRLTGDAGRDRFLFKSGAVFQKSDGIDTITDFKRGEDKIVLARKTFPTLRNLGSFITVKSAAEAQTSTALIAYVRSTGQLFYNPNGEAAGFGGGGQFAVIARSTSANGALHGSDFAVLQNG